MENKSNAATYPATNVSLLRWRIRRFWQYKSAASISYSYLKWNPNNPSVYSYSKWDTSLAICGCFSTNSCKIVNKSSRQKSDRAFRRKYSVKCNSISRSHIQGQHWSHTFCNGDTAVLARYCNNIDNAVTWYKSFLSGERQATTTWQEQSYVISREND